MLADGDAYARVFIPEALRAQYLPGTKVQVSADGITPAMTGQVRYVSAQAAFTPYFALTQKDRGRLSYLAEISLPEADNIPAGLPVQAVLSTP
jgi:HlyD family secretion protein